MDINEVRRQRVRRLVSDHGGQNALARKLGLGNGAYISQLLVEPKQANARNMSERVARKWEKLLKLPDGWMDGEPRAHTPTAGAGNVDAALLAQVIVEVDRALGAAKVTLPAPKRANLVAMQYTDSIATGTVDAARIQSLISLLQS